MAFGLNRVELIGRLGADVTVNASVQGIRNFFRREKNLYINYLRR